MSSSDPTDHVLAAIASMLDQPEVHPEPAPAPVEEKPFAPTIIEPNGYAKLGPGPMAAIRFKWTVRREDDGAYYVDETIGENAASITAGPMTGDAAIKLVDDRESEAQRQFELLKSEMTGRGPAVDPVRKDGGEM